MHNYKNLHIWQDGIKLARRIYEVTGSFPANEKYGIVSQMTRAAVSIPSNIAEGAGRNSNKDFANFLSIAIGSVFELHTQIVICGEIGLIDITTTNIILQTKDRGERPAARGNIPDERTTQKINLTMSEANDLTAKRSYNASGHTAKRSTTK